MQLASERGDIGTLLKIVAQTSTLTPADYIKKTVGSILFLYYNFLDKYHTRPIDMEDFIDGILFMDAKNYIIKRQMQEHRDNG